MWTKRSDRKRGERQAEQPGSETPPEPLAEDHFAPLRNELGKILGVDPERLKP